MADQKRGFFTNIKEKTKRFSARIFTLRITQRMFVMYLSIILLFMGISTITTINAYQNAMENRFQNTVSFNISEIDKTIGTYLMNIFQRSIVLGTSTQIKDLLQEDYSYRPEQQAKDVSAVASQFYNAYSYNDIYSCKIYTDDPGYSCNVGSFEIVENADVKDKVWYKETVARYGGTYWVGNNKDSINDKEIYLLSGYRTIRGFNDTVLGVVRISVNFERIKELLDQALKGFEAAIYLINDKGDTIMLYSDSEVDDAILSGIRDEMKDKQHADGVQQYDDGKILYTYSTIQAAGYKTLTMVTTSALRDEIAGVRNTMLLINFITIILFIIATYYISYSISKPIVELANIMHSPKLGAVPNKYSDRNDEISELFNNFNVMVGRVNNLIEEVKQSNEQKRISEIEALQSQINPHFIYNTLNNIQWLAKADKRKEIISTVTSLDRLLRACARTKGELVTIEQELSYANSYLNIQKIRHENRFNFDYIIDFSLLQFKIPMFILQPIIENSIMHGFSNKPEGGEIIIKILRRKGMVVLTVRDNGQGYSQKEIRTKSIPNVPKTENKDNIVNIGLSNINKRIKLMFGEAYGIKIRSVPGVGTIVKVYIPVTT